MTQHDRWLFQTNGHPTSKQNGTGLLPPPNGLMTYLNLGANLHDVSANGNKMSTPKDT
jgi:hypothetical protein